MLHLALSMLLALSPHDVENAGPQDPRAPTAALQDRDGAQPARPETEVNRGDGKEEPAGNPVPEPGVLLLVGTGLLGLALSARRWRRHVPVHS